MIFYGHHGVTEEERMLGGRFSMDIIIVLSENDCPQDDKLTSVYDYQEMYKIAQYHTVERSYKLIESLTQAIIDDLQTLHPNLGYTVRLRKHQLPIKGVMEYVEYEINRDPLE